MGEYIAAGVLVAVIGVVVIYGLAVRDGDREGTSPATEVVPAQPPPTVEEYEASITEVVAPFLRQAIAFDEGDDPTFMVELVDLTKERVLDMRVPADRRGVHLDLIFTLDAWERAADTGDADTAMTKTADLVATYPWLSP